MTLAETFLLLIFMLWFAIQPAKPEDVDPQVTALRLKIDELQEENRKLRDDLSAANYRLTLWEKRFGMPLPASDNEWDEATRKIREKFRIEAGRGKPRCGDENRLAQVSERNGGTEIKFLLAPPDDLIRKTGMNLKPGTVITTSNDIAAFLDALQSYQNQAGCRFDYELLWATDHDYVEARENRFDKYLYAVKRQHKP
jgi:hypothetical protein